MNYPNELLFSSADTQLWENTEFLLRKRKVIAQIEQLLQHVEQQLKTQIGNYSFPLTTNVQTGKISKGENYQGLPYVVLDFPRYFQKPHVCTFRTLFWWGHFFSCQVVMCGSPAQHYLPHLQQQYNNLLEQEVYCCIHENAWQHHFQAPNMRLIDTLSYEEVAAHSQQYQFIKLARKIPLANYQELISFTLETYQLFFK